MLLFFNEAFVDLNWFLNVFLENSLLENYWYFVVIILGKRNLNNE